MDASELRSLAIRSAAGAGVPHDLGAALRYLQQAAEHGSLESVFLRLTEDLEPVSAP